MARDPGEPPFLFLLAVVAGGVVAGALIALLLAYG